ncbi:MAG TPA: transposase [Pseudonocardiaceae bacterium]|nr:transposase [Pseudonocardiaceae bacterium]
MAFYRHLFPALKAAYPFLLPTQAANLALLVGAIVQQRTLNLTRLARAFPIPAERRVARPKHELLHRLKRLARFLSNRQVDPVAVQVACIPAIWAHLGQPRWVGLLIDWTSFDVGLPGLVGGGVRKYQVLTIAVPRCGRAVPLLSVTYERGKLPAAGSQNRWEEEALARVLEALPPGVRPVVIGDRGFGRAGLIAWLQARGVDYVLRLRRGALITEPDARGWQLGAAGLRPGQARWAPGVRDGTDHDRPRDLVVHLACSGRRPKRRRVNKGKEYQEPWYLATSLGNLGAAVAW